MDKFKEFNANWVCEVYFQKGYDGKPHYMFMDRDRMITIFKKAINHYSISTITANKVKKVLEEWKA